MPTKIKPETVELQERVAAINRVSKVVKGGKRFRFAVLVVVGDGDSQVGTGIEKAKKNMVSVKHDGSTIPHPVVGQFGAARVLLKPCPEGTGVIAGGVVRAIMELGGVKDVVTKVTGRTSNAINIAHATLEAIKATRTGDEIRKLRGLIPDEAAEANSTEAEGDTHGEN